MELERAISELERQEGLSALLMDKIETPMLYINRDQRCLYLNSSLKDLWGVKLDEALGAKLSSFLSPMEREQWEQGLREVFATGREVKAVVTDPSGEELEYELFLQPVTNYQDDVTGVLSVIKGSLRDDGEQGRRFKRATAILNAISELVVYQDLEMRITWANQAAVEAAACDGDQILGNYCYQVWGLRDQPCPGCPVLETLSTGESNMNIIETPEGRHWSIRSYPMYDQEGKLSGAIELTREITESRQQKAELQLLNQRLENKNRELEEMLYVASHDLRSPLLNIQGFSQELESLLEELPGYLSLEAVVKDDIQEALGYIQRSASRMDILLKGILRLSRLGRSAFQKEVIQMDDLLQEVLEELAFQIDKLRDKGQLELVIDPLPPTTGDRVQISQVFSNLLHNALKYRHPERKLEIRVSGSREGDFVRYRVDDNGMGIDEREREKIFELFYHHDQRGGEGMGLTIARRIITGHGGEIWVESHKNQGSSFNFILPATE